jgi:hypothetical protein
MTTVPKASPQLFSIQNPGKWTEGTRQPGKTTVPKASPQSLESNYQLSEWSPAPHYVTAVEPRLTASFYAGHLHLRFGPVPRDLLLVSAPRRPHSGSCLSSSSSARSWTPVLTAHCHSITFGSQRARNGCSQLRPFSDHSFSYTPFLVYAPSDFSPRRPRQSLSLDSHQFSGAFAAVRRSCSLTPRT